MFCLRKPTRDEIETFLTGQRKSAFSYREVGATRSELPKAYTLERFSVRWSAEDDVVYYEILAFSRPREWPAKLARPATRLFQEKFARDSKLAMLNSARAASSAS